jgi:copper oxidase (laccase) domain-containing protein
MMDLPFEQFPALGEIGICHHAFTRRIPGINVSHDKAEALRRLDSTHHKIRRAIGLAECPLLTAEQIHGSEIAVVNHVGTPRRPESFRGATQRADPANKEFPGCDGIITNQRGVALGIRVADCCAVYLVDPKTPAIGLVHSGRKGSELGVVTNAIRQMIGRFGSDPAGMIVKLSPCIRPPHYEVDFATKIIEQCHDQGVNKIHDSGVCTACHLDIYYSYRAEKGRTGRMLALLALR